MTVHYREAMESDVNAMAGIRAASWGAASYWRERILSYMRGEHDPGQALKPRMIIVAEEAGELVGLAAAHLTRRHGCGGELEWIDVADERRGSGVADELLRRVAKWLVERGAPRVCVDVEPGNARARRFYARNGATELRPHWMVWEDIATLAGEE